MASKILDLRIDLKKHNTYWKKNRGQKMLFQ